MRSATWQLEPITSRQNRFVLFWIAKTDKFPFDLRSMLGAFNHPHFFQFFVEIYFAVS